MQVKLKLVKVKPAFLIFVFLLLALGSLLVFGKSAFKQTSTSVSPSPTVVRKSDGFRKLIEREQAANFKGSLETENWRTFSLSVAERYYTFKYPPELISKEEIEVSKPLLRIVNFVPKSIGKENFPILQVRVYNKPIDSLLSEEEMLKVERITFGDVEARKVIGIDTKGHKVEIVYLSLDHLTLVLQGTFFDIDEVEIDCEKIINDVIKSIKIERL